MSNIQEHVQILRSDQTILPGSENGFPFPAHAGTHETGGVDELDTSNMDVIQKSIGTTKGDVIGFTASASPDRLPVGANGYALTADSGEATGLVWAAVPQGDVVGPGSAVDDRIATFDGTTGKLIQDGGYAIDDLCLRSGIVDDTTLSGSIWSITSNPAAGSTAILLDLDAQGAGWASGARVLKITCDSNAVYPLEINNGTVEVGSWRRDGSIRLKEDITFTGGEGSIYTQSDGDLKFLPNGTGINIFGTGSSGFSLSGSGNILVSNDIELQGDLYTDSYLNQTNNLFLGIGVVGAGNLSHASGDEGYHNVGFGLNALYNLTTGHSNIALGTNALYTNNIGGYNVAFGRNALRYNTSGSYNTAIGANALTSNSTGNNNVAFGASALRLNTIGSNNVAIGLSALYANTAGNQNIALGRRALRFNTGGDYNVAVGEDSLYNNTTGNYNTAFGYQTGDNITSGSYNIIMGYGVDPPSATGDYQINIGNVIQCDNWNNNGDVYVVQQGTGVFKVGTSGSNWFKLSHDSADALSEAETGSFVYHHEAPVSLADDGGFDLPNASSGWGFFQIGDGEEYALVSWKADATVTLISNSVNAVNTDTDTKFCIFDNGSSVRVRNRLGTTKIVMFSYHYTT